MCNFCSHGAYMLPYLVRRYGVKSLAEVGVCTGMSVVNVLEQHAAWSGGLAPLERYYMVDPWGEHAAIRAAAARSRCAGWRRPSRPCWCPCRATAPKWRRRFRTRRSTSRSSTPRTTTATCAPTCSRTGRQLKPDGVLAGHDFLHYRNWAEVSQDRQAGRGMFSSVGTGATRAGALRCRRTASRRRRRSSSRTARSPSSSACGGSSAAPARPGRSRPLPSTGSLPLKCYYVIMRAMKSRCRSASIASASAAASRAQLRSSRDAELGVGGASVTASVGGASVTAAISPARVIDAWRGGVAGGGGSSSLLARRLRRREDVAAARVGGALAAHKLGLLPAERRGVQLLAQHAQLRLHRRQRRVLRLHLRRRLLRRVAAAEMRAAAASRSFASAAAAASSRRRNSSACFRAARSASARACSFAPAARRRAAPPPRSFLRADAARCDARSCCFAFAAPCSACSASMVASSRPISARWSERTSFASLKATEELAPVIAVGASGELVRTSRPRSCWRNSASASDARMQQSQLKRPPSPRVSAEAAARDYGGGPKKPPVTPASAIAPRSSVREYRRRGEPPPAGRRPLKKANDNLTNQLQAQVMKQRSEGEGPSSATGRAPPPTRRRPLARPGVDAGGRRGDAGRRRRRRAHVAGGDPPRATPRAPGSERGRRQPRSSRRGGGGGRQQKLHDQHQTKSYLHGDATEPAEPAAKAVSTGDRRIMKGLQRSEAFARRQGRRARRARGCARRASSPPAGASRV